MIDLLEKKDTPATVLNIICLKLFGSEYYNWDPETLKLELKNLPKENYDKIQAMSVIMSTEQFYTYWECFEPICRVLDNSEASFEMGTPLTVCQAVGGIWEAKYNDPDDSHFSREIEEYVKNIFILNGIKSTPKIIRSYFLNTYGNGDEEESYINDYMNLKIKKIQENIQENITK